MFPTSKFRSDRSQQFHHQTQGRISALTASRLHRHKDVAGPSSDLRAPAATHLGKVDVSLPSIPESAGPFHRRVLVQRNQHRLNSSVRMGLH